MMPAAKPLALCVATLIAGTSLNAWGETPATQPLPSADTAEPQQDPTAPAAISTPAVAAGSGSESSSTTRATEFPGIAWRSFLVFPAVTLSATYDDNIYAERPYAPERTYVTGDLVYTLSPSIRLQSNWQRHALNIDAGGDLDRYGSHDSENVDDYWIGGDGRYDLGKETNLFGGLRYTNDHDDRSSPGSDVEQIHPVVFGHEEAHLGLAHSSGNFRLRLGGTYDQYQYQDGVLGSGAAVDNSYRDRSLSSIGMRLGYVLSPVYEVFAQVATDDRRYDRLINGQTFNRDSRGLRSAIGVKFDFKPQQLSGEIFAGLMRQNFAYDGFSDISRPYFSAQVVWKPSARVTATGFIDRALSETSVADELSYASSSTDTTYGFKVERRLTSRLSVNGRAGYTLSQFNDFERRDTIIDVGAGLRYYLTPTMFLATDLRVVDRNSTDLGAQYSRNQVLVSIGYSPARNRDYALVSDQHSGTSDGLRVQGQFSGFYLGGQLGHGALTTLTSGTRGEGEGTDTAQMGGFGTSNGFFVGWGTEINNWYLGLELDGSDSNSSWYHSKDKPDAVTESVAKNRGYGLNLRAGYVFDGGLLYGKLGRVSTNFDTYFTENQFSETGAFNQNRTDIGSRIGVGLEIPASRNLFVRIDYSVTRYGSYLAPHLVSAEGATASETLTSGDSVFSVGLGWRFGGRRPASAERPATAVRGLYLGASLGRGALGTEMSGSQLDSGGALGPYDFTGEFAQSGFAGGFFAGYGYTFRQLYVGVELDVEAANFGWGHDRTTGGGGGRDFAVDRRGGYGAGLRAGYVLPNGSLLYAQAGPVHRRVNTLYNKGASAASWVNQSDSIAGTRVGIGAEIPASQNTFLRLDYSYTRYDNKIEILTTQGGGANADAMSFSNSEGMARLSFGYRF